LCNLICAYRCMLSAKDIRTFPTIAVIIPINEDHRCSCESPVDTTSWGIDGTVASAHAGAFEGVVIAVPRGEVGRYIAVAP